MKKIETNLQVRNNFFFLSYRGYNVLRTSNLKEELRAIHRPIGIYCAETKNREQIKSRFFAWEILKTFLKLYNIFRPINEDSLTGIQ